MTSVRDTLLAWIERDRDTIVEFLSRFVAIPSPNPPGDTRAAAAFLHDRIVALGAPAAYRTAKPEWPNVTGSFASGAGGPHLVLNGHIDVFPAGEAADWSRDPWSGAVADGKVHGRGVADMKCGTAASVFAYVYLHRLREKLGGRLTLTCVSDEETGGTWGSKWLVDTFPDEFRGDCMLNGEPSTPGTVRFGEKGTLRLVFEVSTPGAHAAYTHLSRNAIRIASDLVRDLYALEELHVPAPDDIRQAIAQSRATMDAVLGHGAGRILDRVTVSPGVIQGGLKINILPGRCRLEVDIRLPVGLSHAAVMGEIEKILEQYPDPFGRAERLRSEPPDGRNHPVHGEKPDRPHSGAGGEPRRDRLQALAPSRRASLRLRLHAQQHGQARRVGRRRGISPRRAHPRARGRRISCRVAS
jgi:succinyl-diaminopimelate desuccinylase